MSQLSKIMLAAALSDCHGLRMETLNPVTTSKEKTPELETQKSNPSTENVENPLTSHERCPCGKEMQWFSDHTSGQLKRRIDMAASHTIAENEKIGIPPGHAICEVGVKVKDTSGNMLSLGGDCHALCFSWDCDKCKTSPLGVGCAPCKPRYLCVDDRCNEFFELCAKCGTPDDKTRPSRNADYLPSSNPPSWLWMNTDLPEDPVATRIGQEHFGTKGRPCNFQDFSGCYDYKWDKEVKLY